MSAFSTTTTLADKTNVTVLRFLVERIKERGVRVGFDAVTSELFIVVTEPPSLQSAPPGTHDFARGWIQRGRLVEIQGLVIPYTISKKITWVPTEVDALGHVTKTYPDDAFEVSS